MTVKLSEIEKAAEGATSGPWKRGWYAGVVDPKSRVMTDRDGYNSCLADYLSEPDATFIAASRTAVPALTAALRDVLTLHRPVRYAGADSPAIVPRFVCDACIAECDGAIPYPCPTVRAITAHVDPT